MAERALVAEIDFQSALFVRSAVAGRVDVQSFLLDVSEKPAEPAVAAALQVATGIPVICLDQVRGWEGRLVLQSQSWFHPRLNLSGHEDFRQPLYGLLKEVTGVAADHAREEFVAVTADTPIAHRLQVKRGTPLLLRRRTTVDADGRPIDYAEIYYHTGEISLTLTSRWEPVD